MKLTFTKEKLIALIQAYIDKVVEGQERAKTPSFLKEAKNTAIKEEQNRIEACKERISYHEDSISAIRKAKSVQELSKLAAFYVYETDLSECRRAIKILEASAEDKIIIDTLREGTLSTVLNQIV